MSANAYARTLIITEQTESSTVTARERERENRLAEHEIFFVYTKKVIRSFGSIIIDAVTTIDAVVVLVVIGLLMV